MLEKITLRGLNFGLSEIHSKTYTYKVYVSDDIKKNVTILSKNYQKNGNNDHVFNSISEKNFNALIQFLNHNNNVIILWTKVEGMTSDYIIFCDAHYDKNMKTPELHKYLTDLAGGKDIFNPEWKYMIVKDSEFEPIILPEDENPVV